MKKNLRAALSLFLCILLLLSGCSKDKKSNPNPTQVKSSTSSASSGSSLRPIPVGTGIKAEPLERFPAGFKSKYPLKQGSWSIDRPLFDPLGSESSYLQVSKYYDTNKLLYINQDFRLTNQIVAGDSWRMDLTDDSPDAMLHLEKYIQDIGGTVLTPPSEEIAFVLEDIEGYNWWGKITSGETIYIEVYREPLLKVGNTLNIQPGDLSDQDNFYFTTRHNGNRMQSLTVKLTGTFNDGDTITLTSNGGYNSGRYERKVTYSVYLEAGTNKTDVFILDDIPQEPGYTIWTLLSDNEGMSVDISLNEIADLTPIKYGENLGALLVKGVPYGSLSVPLKEASFHSAYTIRHPDLNEDLNMLYGDQTPDGDTMFWLPTGYWSLNIQSDILNSTSNARLIPISEGELTVVDMASNIGSIFSETSGTTVGTEEHGMTFLEDPKEQGDKVTLQFLLFDSQNKDAKPTKDTTVIHENGAPVEILSVDKMDIPPSVVLLLDSSGSMADQMQPAIDSAKAFVQGLPDNATIQVIDFDNTARLLPGKTKAEVLKSLDSATTGGSTALYDAAVMGLNLLKDAPRPTLVMFTDGKNEPASGGLTNKSTVIDAVQAAGVPIYTIGFGKEHAPTNIQKTADTDDSSTTKQSVNTDLIDFATISGGKYYSALDQDALKNVFAAIAARLGNTYTAVYKRPEQSAVTDVPVVTIVLDRSGSMDEFIEGQGTKMQIAKDMFREFIMNMPDGIMTQLITFEEVWLDQVLTTDKAAILQAISNLEATGGTSIVDSAKLGYDTLRVVPTSNRILIFLTDAAMEGSDNDVFASLLADIKEADIKSLWLGLGMEQEGDEQNFAWASQTAGGTYLLPNSAQELSAGLTKMLAEVKGKGSNDKTLISINITLPNELGKLQSYSGSIEHKLSPLKSSGKTLEAPKAIKITMGPLTSTKPAASTVNVSASERYSPETSQLLYGGDLPSTDTRISSRMPLKNAKQKSSGIEITATEYFRLSKLRGIYPPPNMEYLAVNIQLKNLFSDRPFQIPDICSHFYINVNDTGSYPASIVTWLAETPLAAPGENSIEVAPSQTHQGALIFLVPAEPLEDLQLDFYDTVHGNIQLTLLGTPKQSDVKLDKLSKSAPAKLSDTFTLTITAYKDVDKIQQHTAPADSVFRIVEGELTSKVQALLDIAPSERFFMNIATSQGIFRIPISPATGYIPYGYLQPKLLAPASVTPIRWVFTVPKALTNANAEIYGDIADGAIYIPVKSGTSPASSSNLGTFKGDWIDVTINQLSTLTPAQATALYSTPDGYMEEPEEIIEVVEVEPIVEEEYFQGDEEYTNDEYYDDEYLEEEYQEDIPIYVVADITVTDKKDGYGTSEIYNAFKFISDRIENGNSKGSFIIDGEEQEGFYGYNTGELAYEPDPITSSLILGIDEDWSVMDGESRRGVMVFSLPNNRFTLQSQYFEGLKISPKYTSISDSKLLSKNMIVLTEEQDFADRMLAEIEKVVEKYQSEHATVAQHGETTVVSLSQGDGKNNIPYPALNGTGTKLLNSPNTLEDVLNLLRSLAWRPSYSNNWFNWITDMSPEAVLTQGWGSEYDLALLAEQLLTKLGLNPERTEVKLTKEGQQTLVDYLNIEDVETLVMSKLPALSYRNSDGKYNLLVIPFMKHFSDIGGFVQLTIPNEAPIEVSGRIATVTVKVVTIPTGKSEGSGGYDTSGLFGALSDGLTEEDYEEDYDYKETTDIELFSQDFLLKDLSNGAIDIGFGVAEGKVYAAYMDSPGGRLFSKENINRDYYEPIGIITTVTTDNSEYTHETTLKKGETLDCIFTTIGINLPDLPEDALTNLDRATSETHGKAKVPNEVSSLRWYTRNNLYRFVGAQTSYEDQLAADLNLTIGRTTKPRCIAVTVRSEKNGSSFYTSIDLVSVVNQIHNGTKEAANSFNIMSGLTASRMEGVALGSGGHDFTVLWDNAPDDMDLIYLTSYTTPDNFPVLREAGFPEKLVQRMEKAQEQGMVEVLYIIQDMPTDIGGQKRWAWLEVDSQTFETIAVLDTGEKGGFAEFILLTPQQPEGKSFAEYGVGVLAGVDTGMWSVAAATLITADYEETLKLAAQYASQVSENVHNFFDMVDAAKSAKELSPTKLNWKKGRTDATTIVGPDGAGGAMLKTLPGKEYLQLEINVEFLGIVEGFDDGLMFYFKNLSE